MSKEQAQINASCAIAVGIILDQVRALRQAGALKAKGAAKAVQVETYAQAVLNTLPTITSARGCKRIREACDVIRAGFKSQYPHMSETAVMGALCAIFAAHATMCELIRKHRIKGQNWRRLDQTSTTLVGLILGDMPEEEAKLWAASVPVLEMMEVAA